MVRETDTDQEKNSCAYPETTSQPAWSASAPSTLRAQDIPAFRWRKRSSDCFADMVEERIQSLSPKGLGSTVINLLAQTKVGNHNVAVLIKQNILRFDVTVHHTQLEDETKERKESESTAQVHHEKSPLHTVWQCSIAAAISATYSLTRFSLKRPSFLRWKKSSPPLTKSRIIKSLRDAKE